MSKKIGIVGFGYVGQSIKKLFENHYQIGIYDPAYLNLSDKNVVNNCELGIICCPTPMKKNGECDISAVEESIAWLNTPLILIKSTIPPGTTDYLKKKYNKRIVFNPEYIGEGKYYTSPWKYPHPTEIKYHSFQVFGGDDDDISEIIDYFVLVLGPEKKYIQVDAKTAELSKYMSNCWGATKVTFCNEFYEIAKVFGVNYHKLRELFLLDERHEEIHTVVFKDKRGFGGKCFPKDLNAIVQASKKQGYQPVFLEEVIQTNNKFIQKNP